MTLSPQQDDAIKAVDRWLADKSGKQFFYLAGYAGTGKTFLAQRFAEDVKGKVVFGAFTGKAALVMRSKGCPMASTIHSLIYKPREEAGVTTFILNRDSTVKDAALVVIDEVSMVGEELARDLLSFGKRILVLGDPAQLPPVKDAAFFTGGTPDVMLTEIHRQAADNPIIRMSMLVREGRGLEIGRYGDSRVVRRKDLDGDDARYADQILVGLNKTRTRFNGRMRDIKGYSGELPQEGERLVCLKNDRNKGLLNGSIWSVAKAGKRKKSGITMHLSPLDEGAADVNVSVNAHILPFEGRAHDIPRNERGEYEQFDFGYALTVHKAQGSQWDDVCLFDESFAFRDDRDRHLYTGITRAAEKITVVTS